MKKYKITYKQKFMGKIITASYERYVENNSELYQSINALYTDPHVIDVSHELIKD